MYVSRSYLTAETSARVEEASFPMSICQMCLSDLLCQKISCDVILVVCGKCSEGRKPLLKKNTIRSIDCRNEEFGRRQAVPLVGQVNVVALSGSGGGTVKCPPCSNSQLFQCWIACKLTSFLTPSGVVVFKAALSVVDHMLSMELRPIIAQRYTL